MGAPENFFRDLQSFLNVSIAAVTTIDPVSGPPAGRGKINVGERFDLSLRITNTAPGVLSDAGIYIFQNIRVALMRNNDGFAVPLNANGSEAEFRELPLNPTVLRAGQSGIVQFPMIAKRNMGGFMDWFLAEEIGQVSVRSQFDFNSYFNITGIRKTLSLEIEP